MVVGVTGYIGRKESCEKHEEDIKDLMAYLAEVQDMHWSPDE